MKGFSVASVLFEEISAAMASDSEIQDMRLTRKAVVTLQTGRIVPMCSTLVIMLDREGRLLPKTWMQQDILDHLDRASSPRQTSASNALLSMPPGLKRGRW